MRFFGFQNESSEAGLTQPWHKREILKKAGINCRARILKHPSPPPLSANENEPCLGAPETRVKYSPIWKDASGIFCNFTIILHSMPGGNPRGCQVTS